MNRRYLFRTTGAAIVGILTATTASAQTGKPRDAGSSRWPTPCSRAVEHNPDLAIVRLGTEVEAARVGESRSAFSPVFSTTLGRSSNVTPPSNFLLGDRGVDVNDCFSSTGVRQRLPWGAGTWSVSWDTSRTTTNNPITQLRSGASVGVPDRVLAAAAEGSHDRRGATAVHHREAEPGELRASLPRVRRPDGGRGQAGVLDAQGDPGERHRSAAVARARAGARAAEQDSRRGRTDSAARSRAGGSRGRAAAREPDSRQHRLPGMPRIGCGG